MGFIRYDTLDISANNFAQIYQIPKIDINVRTPLRLWKLAAHVVVRKRILYTPESLPKCLFYVLDRTPICTCGRICFSEVIIEKQYFLDLNALNLIKDDGNILADAIMCEHCFVPKRVAVR